MALIEDIFKGNLATGLAVGVGAIIFGPTVIQTVGSILRPAAKTLIKGSMIFYRETLGEIGGAVVDGEAGHLTDHNFGEACNALAAEAVRATGYGGRRYGS